MANIVQQFGNAVQKTCTKDPLKARRLLRIGYHAKICSSNSRLENSTAQPDWRRGAQHRRWWRRWIILMKRSW